MYKIPDNKGELSTCVVRYQNCHVSKTFHWIQLNDTRQMSKWLNILWTFKLINIGTVPINILLLNKCLFKRYYISMHCHSNKNPSHRQTMSVVGIIKYAENGSSWMISCRIYSCEKGCDNTPLFLESLKTLLQYKL
jgi:hypothetical protein